MGIDLFGSKAKTKSAWDTTPGTVREMVNSNAIGLADISKDARDQYQKDMEAGYQQYTDNRVADFSAPEQAGLDILTGMQGQLDPIEGQINDLGGFDAMLADNPQLIEQLYNPYQQGVIDNTMSDLDRLQKMKQMERNAAAGAAGSFGGSRAGVMDALAAGEETRSNAAVLAGLRKEGWDTASGLASKDLDRQAGYNTSYMDTLRGLYGDKGNLLLDQSKGLEGIGATQRDIAQKGLDVAYGDWQAEQNFPWLTMGKAQGVLGRTNPATDAAAAPTVQTPGSAGLLNTLVGGASAGVGTYLGSKMACDVRLKRDIERVGTLPSGAGLFAFSYIWDDPGDRRVAPVAQDLARFVPEAVFADENGILLVRTDLVR